MTDQPSREGERWTIYVCPSCGQSWDSPGACAGTMKGCDELTDAHALKVVPASTLQAAEAERDEWKRMALKRVPSGSIRLLKAQLRLKWEQRLRAAEARESALREGVEKAYRLHSNSTPIEQGKWGREAMNILRSLLSTQEPTR